MTSPIDTPPIPDPIPDGVNVGSQEPEGTTLAPSIFFAQNDQEEVGTQLNEPLPRAWGPSGLIEATKRAVVMGIRDGLRASTMSAIGGENEKFTIDIEYPTDVTQFPGVWVQFQVSKLQRAGLGMEVWVLDNDSNWSSIQQWIFEGTITLSLAALSSKERDRLADVVVSSLAFSRAPNPVITKAGQDTKEFRGLITSLNNNPYIAITLGTDIINCGGQTVTGGTPWAQNVLLYDDGYSVTCHGQLNMEFSHDGLYTLRAIDVIPTISATNVVYNPVTGQRPPLPPLTAPGGYVPYQAS